MPSMQRALPPELADNAIRQHNTELFVGMVRDQFKKNIHENSDLEKIQMLKDDAARRLINHIIYKAERITVRKFSRGL